MPRIDPEVLEWLRREGGGEITLVQPAGGGSIHQSLIIKTDCGTSYFLKQNLHSPADMFFREAQGLMTLQGSHGPFSPFVLKVGRRYLLLEDMQPAPPALDFWRIFGHQMARLHRKSDLRFGFQIDNYIGSNPQYNNYSSNGYEFYCYRRYLPQMIWARDRSLIDARDVKNLERFMYCLPELIPRQPPVLLHGDLWSGNLITDAFGMPVVVDPAVYYGWAEADLAMAELFGSYPDDFYQAYTEVNPLIKDYRSRFPFYNLYHLLNHLNIFGRRYLVHIREILRVFSSN